MLTQVASGQAGLHEEAGAKTLIALIDGRDLHHVDSHDLDALAR